MASEFFSNHEPTAQDIQTIRRIPVPPAKTVADIVAKAAVTTGACSVKCLHVPSGWGKRVPMWIIIFWAEVLQLRGHSVRICDGNVDNTMTLYRLRRASGRPPNCT